MFKSLGIFFCFLAITAHGQTNFQSSSVLQNGTWLKIGIVSDGIYDLPLSSLAAAGILVNQPERIGIFAGHPTQLPMANSDQFTDDLVEVPTQSIMNSNNQVEKIRFYGKGPHQWNIQVDTFFYQHHLYSDTNYYYVTVLNQPAKKIISTGLLTSPSIINRETDSYWAIDLNKKSVSRSGQQWFDDELDGATVREYATDFQSLVTGNPIDLIFNVGARSYSVNPVVSLQEKNGTFLGMYPFSAIFNYTYAAKMRMFDQGKRISFIPSTGNPIIQVSFNKNGDPGAIGYVDYFMAKARTRLEWPSTNQLTFRETNLLSPGQTRSIAMNTSEPASAWNIQDPLNPFEYVGNRSGNSIAWTIPADTLLPVQLFKSNAVFPSPIILGKINNQNLHALPIPQLIIVYHPQFKSETERLLQHKLSMGWNAIAVSVLDIYEEFASGKQDIGAIRNFIRMFYERPNGKVLQHVLLIGDASYDFKNRISNNTNFIPTFESPETVEPLYSYSCDFFYGMLDSLEGRFSIIDRGNMDVGIGRLPVHTNQQAKIMVDKIIEYESNASAGDWKSQITLVADDADFNKHLEDSEILTDSIQRNFKEAVVEKLYLDAFPRVSTPGGSRYPAVNQAINNRINQGALIVNYVGHGGVNGWADERVLTPEDVLTWSAQGKYPIFVTATCEFSRFDDPAKISVGEQIGFKEKGGPVSSITTVRLTYSEPNLDFTKRLYHQFFEKDSTGKCQPIGVSFRNAINLTGIDNANTRCLTLLGDPSLRPAIPQQKISINKINGLTPGADTIKALSKVRIEGQIDDLTVGIDSNFQGVVTLMVFDKTQVFYTFGAANQSIAVPVNSQNNLLFKGKASVVDGKFLVEFITPKDIAYQFGNGRIIAYAISDQKKEALGEDKRCIIGGTANNFASDENGPQIQAYLNTTAFVDGGITHNHPVLLARVFDESGMNTVGNGIGHDMVMILDGQADQPFVLNQYFESDLNDFQRGWIRFPMYGISPGKHVLEVKVWDVHNNLGSSTLNFEVIDTLLPQLLNIGCYPNPSNGNVTFTFSHNLAEMPLEATLEIMEISGKSVFQSTKNFTPTGFVENAFQWDGTNQFSKKVADGLYVYRITLRLKSGQSLQACQKLIRISE